MDINNNINADRVIDIDRNTSIFFHSIQNYPNKIKNICTHEWITDLIDIDPDKSLSICYCVKCNVTKE